MRKLLISFCIFNLNVFILFAQDIELNSGYSLIGNSNSTSTQLLYWNGSNAYYGRKLSGTIGVSNHYFRIDGETKLIINSTGNIGIGTDSPSELLHVSKGNVRFEFNSQYGNDPIIVFENEGTNADIRQSFYRWSGISNQYWGTRFEREANAGFKIKMASPSTIGLHSFVDALTILNDGRIGIGTTSPTEKLVVDGKILAEEVKVQTVPSSDYVFEPDYNLLSLKEVESFIQQNKHLPDIPSAEEFKENGVGLGEMDDMLLRKVEELTLYVIELKRENEKLKSEVNNLKSTVYHE